MDHSSKITVILNVYRRPEYLREQIEAIRNQSEGDIELWVWVNAHEDNCNIDYNSYDVDKIIHSSHNFKYLGRFSLAFLAQTEYVAIFDDDTIPGKDWFRNCLNVQNKLKKELIIGGVGVILKSPNYVNHVRVGWPSPEIKDIYRVDLVGHAWFFKKSVLKYLWMEEPFSYDNGEDIHFSYVAQKYGNIMTVVPPQQTMETTSSTKAWKYGSDNKASSNGSLMSIPEFYKQRDECIQHAIRNGWKTKEGIIC